MTSEQKICVSCGFCCDGTLFLHARLNPGEKGNLPEKIEKNSFTINEKEYFSLPCKYFSEKCTIYKKKRADICSSYYCQLIRDFSEKKISHNEALEIVRKALEIREEIFIEYNNLFLKKEVLCFKELVEKVIKNNNDPLWDANDMKRYAVLVGKCNILEALLMKHIRSAGEFSGIMSNTED